MVSGGGRKRGRGCVSLERERERGEWGREKEREGMCQFRERERERGEWGREKEREGCVCPSVILSGESSPEHENTFL